MQVEVSWFVAIGAGLLSFFSPCILPLLPAYLSFITGVGVDEILEGEAKTHRVLPQVILFCLGFSLVFVLMGATATSIGRAVFQYQRLIQWVGGVLIIFFGLYLLGVFQFRFLQLERRIHLANRPAHAFGAFLVGLTFAAGWTPCIGPMLGSILTYAGTQETVTKGVFLLALFSLGLAVPFIAVGLAVGTVLPWIRKARGLMKWVSIVSGVMLILVGLLLITDRFNAIFDFAM